MNPYRAVSAFRRGDGGGEHRDRGGGENPPPPGRLDRGSYRPGVGR